MAKVIGVDLGTTNTVVAVMDGARPRIIETSEGKNEMRSVVSVKRRRDRQTGREEREELVGHVAEDNCALAPLDTVISVKRLMGRSVDDLEVAQVKNRYRYQIAAPSGGTNDSLRVLLAGEELSPADVSAKILRRAKEDAERACGEEVKYAVITVPAYFSEAQRDATKKAGTKAGLTVVKLLDEPTAAAVAFGVDGASPEDVRTVLVYDLGGGTFDISVLVMAGSVLAPLALQGDMWLGGDDFDQKLIDVVLYSVRDEFGVDGRKNDRFMVELRKAARTVKERLTINQTAPLIVPGLLRNREQNLIDVSLEFTREDFESMIRPLVDRTIELTHQAIRDANLTPDRIDCVLLAGNASRTPLVQREIEKLFGAQKILRNVPPKHSVALGAAIVAARIGERVICQGRDPAGMERECGFVNKPDATHCARPDCGAVLPVPVDGEPAIPSSVAPFHYGAQTVEDRFTLFVHKGDPYPTEKRTTHVFGTNRPNQRIITVPVYGGENLERASANEKQGEAVALLPPGLPQGASIAITLWLDEEGLFAISGRLEDGTDLHALKTKGESDAKAIAILLEVEHLLASRSARGQELTAAQVSRVEQSGNLVFEKLRAGVPMAALQHAELLRATVNNILRSDEVGGQVDKQAILNYCEWIAERYSWAAPDEMGEFANLVERARRAVQERSPSEAETHLQELDEAWSSLPDSVHRFLRCRRVILRRLRPVDLAGAALFERDLDGLEQAFKGNNPRAEEWWEGFMKRLNQTLDRTEHERPSVIRCYNGHEVAPGNRYCLAPGCGVDVTGLTDKSAHRGKVSAQLML